VTVLEVTDLSTSLGGVTILDGLSLDVAEARRAVLFGPNGTGESTLFRCIVGVQRYGGLIAIDEDP